MVCLWFTFELLLLFGVFYCCTRHALEDLALKTNFNCHAETCSQILPSSLGCGVSPPMLSSNFLGRCPNHERISRTMDDAHEISRHRQWFLSVFWEYWSTNRSPQKKEQPYVPTTDRPPHSLVFFVVSIGFGNFGQTLQQNPPGNQTKHVNYGPLGHTVGRDRDSCIFPKMEILCFWFVFDIGSDFTN